MKLADKGFAVSISIILIYWIILVTSPIITSPLSQFFEWMAEIAIILGYWGTFLACLLGSASVIVEVPFAGIPFVLGGLRDSLTGPFLFNPWIIGIISGIGATIGDMTSYALGYFGRRFADEANSSGFSRFIDHHPRATPLAVFILASTPMPLDPAVVALGIARYQWWKLFVPCLVGEIIFLTGVAWAGRLSLDWIIALLGVGSPVTPLSAAVEVFGIFLLILAVYLTVRIDWIALTKRFKEANHE
ncbi:hypothetical protein EU527_05545 [Candidatus Thorarchaeota archaeon]|nr:MAG: hypothetical protein EU527_05545 [Candidatus Thorarchaeota archaeon]